MKRYGLEFTGTAIDDTQDMIEREDGDWVTYIDAMVRIAELTAERDEARDLVKKAKCCVFVGAIDEAVARWR